MGEGEIDAIVEVPIVGQGVGLTGIDIITVDGLLFIHQEVLPDVLRLIGEILRHRAIVARIIHAEIQAEGGGVIHVDILHLGFAGFQVVRFHEIARRVLMRTVAGLERGGIGGVQAAPFRDLVIHTEPQVMIQRFGVARIDLVDIVALPSQSVMGNHLHIRVRMRKVWGIAQVC